MADQGLKCLTDSVRLGSVAMKAAVSDPREVEFYEDLAWRLKLAVEALDVSKTDVAEAIGVSPQRLSNWLHAGNRPDWFAIAKLCRRFNISPGWVLLGELAQVPMALGANWERAAEERQAARRA